MIAELRELRLGRLRQPGRHRARRDARHALRRRRRGGDQSEVSSVRDSDRIIGMLDSKTLRAERGEGIEKHLLITRYDAARAARGEMMKVEDVLEILAIPLLGIVAESPDVLTASNLGCPVTLHNPAAPAARAYALPRAG